MLKRWLLVASLAGCVTAPTTGDNTMPAPAIQVHAGRPFQIVVGQEARLQNASIVIRLASVAEDSRCPRDVQCVWAGNARLVLELSGAASATTSASVNSTLEPRSVTYGGYVIRFVGMGPMPQSGKSIPLADYVATLEVSAG